MCQCLAWQVCTCMCVCVCISIKQQTKTHLWRVGARGARRNQYEGRAEGRRLEPPRAQRTLVCHRPTRLLHPYSASVSAVDRGAHPPCMCSSSVLASLGASSTAPTDWRDSRMRGHVHAPHM